MSLSGVATTWQLSALLSGCMVQLTVIEYVSLGGGGVTVVSISVTDEDTKLKKYLSMSYGSHHGLLISTVSLSAGPSPNLFSGVTVMLTYPENTPSGNSGAINVKLESVIFFLNTSLI